jgi:hypothetical protein
MLVIQINGSRMEKSIKDGKLVPEKRTVTRGGKAFQMTFWVDPDTGSPGKGDLSSITEEEMNRRVAVMKDRVKNGYQYRAQGVSVMVKKPGNEEWEVLAPMANERLAQDMAVKLTKNENASWDGKDTAGNGNSDGPDGGALLEDVRGALNAVRNFKYHGDKYKTTYDLVSAIEHGAVDLEAALHEAREAFSMMTNRKLHDGKYRDTYAVANAIDDAFHAWGTRGARVKNTGTEPIWRANGKALEVKKPGADQWEHMVDTDDPEKTKALVEKMQAFSGKKTITKSIGMFIRNLKKGR